MKYYDLTNEEKKLVKDFENGEFTSVDRLASQKKIYQGFAKNTLSKKANINLRLSNKVIQKLKAKAVENGIPYQTLASSVLHRFAIN